MVSPLTFNWVVGWPILRVNILAIQFSTRPKNAILTIFSNQTTDDLFVLAWETKPWGQWSNFNQKLTPNTLNTRGFTDQSKRFKALHSTGKTWFCKAQVVTLSKTNFHKNFLVYSYGNYTSKTKYKIHIKIETCISALYIQAVK